MPGASGGTPTSRLVALPKRRHAVSRKRSIRKPASTRTSATPRPSDDDWRQWVRVNEAWRGPPLAKPGLTKHWVETAGVLFSSSRNRKELPEHSNSDGFANESISIIDAITLRDQTPNRGALFSKRNEVTHSIIDRISGDKIKRDWFPRAIIENALPDGYYQELARTFPSLTNVVGISELKNNSPYRTLAIEALEDATLPQIWREFIAYHCSAEFYQRLIDIWGADIEAVHCHITREFGKPLRDFKVGSRHEGKADNPLNRTFDIMMDCQFSYNSPVHQVSSVRGPHLDSPHKLFAALLYFRYPDDTSTGGDLEFYRLVRGRYPKPRPARIDPGCVERIETVPYWPNTLVMFINSPFAIHGVTARSATQWSRRYLNFLGECYRGKSNDFFIAADPGLPRFCRSLTAIAHRYL